MNKFYAIRQKTGLFLPKGKIIMNKFYAIRQKSTGLFLPITKKSFTKAEPSNEIPRLFKTKRGAKVSLNFWLKGEYSLIHEYYKTDDCDIFPYITLSKPRPDRIKEDYEVVEVALFISRKIISVKL